MQLKFHMKYLLRGKFIDIRSNSVNYDYDILECDAM
jgi:hypothetical protein